MAPRGRIVPQIGGTRAAAVVSCGGPILPCMRFIMRTTLCLTLAASLLLAGAGLVRADDEAAVRAVLDKAIKAHGGAEKLAKFKASTTKMKGKFFGSGTPIDYTGEIIIQLPEKSKITIEGEVMGQKFSFSQVFVGGKGWELNSFEGKTQDLDKD